VSIKKAKKLSKIFNVRLDLKIQKVTKKLKFPDESFDIVFISGALYYLDF
jgi:hypothetical protein